MSAKILIVDDHEVVRQGVRSILSERPDWEICAEAANGDEAILAATTLRPDVVIMDVTMPGMSGLEAASRIVAAVPEARILIFSMHESGRIADDVREAHAHGYVQKSQAARDLVLAVDRLLSGDTFFSPETAATPKPKKHRKAAANSGFTSRRALCFA
jgi:DNA-binding NarL/FixJ family response regulator